jgi:hypothetical protein
MVFQEKTTQISIIHDSPKLLEDVPLVLRARVVLAEQCDTYSVTQSWLKYIYRRTHCMASRVTRSVPSRFLPLGTLKVSCVCSSSWQRRITSPSHCGCLSDYPQLPRHLWTDAVVRRLATRGVVRSDGRRGETKGVEERRGSARQGENIAHYCCVIAFWGSCASTTPAYSKYVTV